VPGHHGQRQSGEQRDAVFETERVTGQDKTGRANHKQHRRRTQAGLPEEAGIFAGRERQNERHRRGVDPSSHGEDRQSYREKDERYQNTLA
jgi:hypothetical protein